MTVTLQNEPILPPEFRIAYSDGWTNEWTMLPMWGDGPGMRVISVTRSTLPEVGEAIIAADFGVIDEQDVFVVTGGDGTWGTDAYFDMPDLLKKIIRIQVKDAPENQSTTTWTTVFVGVARFASDETPAAARAGYGVRTWRVVDLLFGYASQWPLNEHDWTPPDAATHTQCPGHPGYNVDNGTGTLVGNRHEI